MKDFEMIKRKLIATKEFFKDYGLEITIGAAAVATIAIAAVAADLEEVADKTTEVFETATHTIILIPN